MIRPGDTVRVDDATVTYRVDRIGQPGERAVLYEAQWSWDRSLVIDVDRLTVVSREVA